MIPSLVVIDQHVMILYKLPFIFFPVKCEYLAFPPCGLDLGVNLMGHVQKQYVCFLAAIIQGVH